MPFDTSNLAPTSSKVRLRWRDTSLTFIRLGADGVLEVAHTIVGKALMLEALQRGDCLLAVRQVQYPTRQEVMVVDDVARARQALGAT